MAEPISAPELVQTIEKEMQHNRSTTDTLDEQAIIDALADWKARSNSPPEELALDPENDHVIWLVSPWHRQQVVLGESWDYAKLVSVHAKFRQRATD